MASYFFILIPIVLGIIGFRIFWDEIGQFALDERQAKYQLVLDYRIIREGEEFAPYVKLGSNWYRICGTHNIIVNPSMLAEGLYFKCDSYEGAINVIENHKKHRNIRGTPDVEVYNSLYQ